jgi:hypothetical protein
MFSQMVWAHALVLLVGAMLAPGKRTMTATLRIMGLQDDKHFINYHWVLSRASWSPLQLGRILLGLLVTLLLSTNVPLIFGVEDTLERWRGVRIKTKGVFRDAVQSSESRVVTAYGLRWVCVMLIVPLPWSQRPWALPCLTVLAPSARTPSAAGHRHKSCVDWARQLLKQVRRWYPQRAMVWVADGAYAAVSFGLACGAFRQPVIFVSRLRLDAALYDPAPLPDPHRRGRKPLKGARQLALKTRAADAHTAWQTTTLAWYQGSQRTLQVLTGTALWYTPGSAPLAIRWVLLRDPQGQLRDQAFLCTDVQASVEQIVRWVLLRWNLEVTFEEVRAHLGVETQRQWSDLAIARTTPCLLGLFSLVTLIAHELAPNHQLPIQQAAWYQKSEATFADALAYVRQRIGGALYGVKSAPNAEDVLMPATYANRLLNALAYTQ